MRRALPAISFLSAAFLIALSVTACSSSDDKSADDTARSISDQDLSQMVLRLEQFPLEYQGFNASDKNGARTLEERVDEAFDHDKSRARLQQFGFVSGYHTTYELQQPSNPTPGGNACDVTIWALGYRSQQCGTDTATLDPTTPSPNLMIASMMRWGNCDAANGLIAANCRFVNAEVPSLISPFANPLPNSHELRASWYYAAPPTAWWGHTSAWGLPNPAWPPIGPDVLNGTVPNVGGLAYKIPARLCYENTPADTTNYGGLSPVPLNFSRTTCYQAAQ